MNDEEKDKIIKTLTEEKEELINRLKKYTNSDRYKVYYEANKDKLNVKKRIYQKEYYNKKKTKCKTDLCDTLINNIEIYEGYCIYCYINLFPDNTIVKNYKTKERSVSDYIIDTFPNYDWIFDKKVFEGCSRRRPDILLDLGYQIIIIEVDENQHVSYDCSCDNKRLMEISQDVGHRPLIFIRFNPDEYLDKEGNKIPSCWTVTTKQGLLKITNKKIWNNRLNILKENIEYWIENKTDKTIEIIQLFYNQN